MSKASTYIISGGSIDLRFAGELLKKETGITVIAADRGLEACAALHIVPDMIIGDFDSLSEEGKQKLKDYPSETITLPSVKDCTDTEAALTLAFAKTKGDIIILGGTGTRLDHVLGNLSVLGQGIGQNRNVTLMDAHNRITVVKEKMTIKKAEQFGKYVSVFPYGEKAEQVSLRGFFYPLENAVLDIATSLGVSNEIVDEEAVIFVGKGKLLVVESRD